MTPAIPARVAALAAWIADEPLSWREREDGSIVIVFNQRGKLTFDKDFEIKTHNQILTPEIPAVLPAKDDEPLVEQRTPTLETATLKKSKRKEKHDSHS